MLQKTKGIVLHTLKYNDTSIIVDMYTELSGRASFLVAVPRSRKAAVKSVLFQPLSFIEFEADYRPNATLYRVKEAKSFYPFSSIPYDPYKSSMALFLAEFLYRAVREEAENLSVVLPICNILSFGWTSAVRVFANFSSGLSDEAFPFPGALSQSRRLSCRRLFRLAECLLHFHSSPVAFILYQSRRCRAASATDAYEL